ncbi:unnamed protein product [Phytophthora fragariaefolia]|uniref:Unnamed protein product n=1 Tax=Phytophthora fragariaefolia TaxID=1490495 RepID=A0A9W6Y411_9STRA|nr:unnamed protein product [Phytophthora fragariaefolia]
MYTRPPDSGADNKSRSLRLSCRNAVGGGGRTDPAGLARLRSASSEQRLDALWSWTTEAQQALEAIKRSLQSAPILALPDDDRPFSVVCDASDFAIGCAKGRERVIAFPSRQLKAWKLPKYLQGT